MRSRAGKLAAYLHISKPTAPRRGNDTKRLEFITACISACRAYLLRRRQSLRMSVAQNPAYNGDAENDTVLPIISKSRNMRIQVSIKDKRNKSETSSKQQNTGQKVMSDGKPSDDRHCSDNQPTHQPDVNNKPAQLQALTAERIKPMCNGQQKPKFHPQRRQNALRKLP
jgi:hypothetical protein